MTDLLEEVETRAAGFGLGLHRLEACATEARATQDFLLSHPGAGR